VIVFSNHKGIRHALRYPYPELRWHQDLSPGAMPCLDVRADKRVLHTAKLSEDKPQEVRDLLIMSLIIDERVKTMLAHRDLTQGYRLKMREDGVEVWLRAGRKKVFLPTG
jgi:hypothetical protein